MYLYLLITALLFFSVPASAGDFREEMCVDLGYPADCWIELEREHCKGQGKKQNCISDPEPVPLNLPALVENPSSELCTLLSTREGRQAAILETGRIKQTYELPKITVNSSVTYPCGNKTCRAEERLQTIVSNLARTAPDIFIWGNALACGHLPRDNYPYDEPPYQPYPDGSSIDVIQESLGALYTEMCNSLETIEQRAEMTTPKMHRRYGRVLSSLITVRVGQEFAGGDLPVIEAQTVACGWYAHQRNPVRLRDGQRKR